MNWSWSKPAKLIWYLETICQEKNYYRISNDHEKKLRLLEVALPYPRRIVFDSSELCSLVERTEWAERFVIADHFR